MKKTFALITLMVVSNFAHAQFRPKEVRYDVKITRRGDMVGFEKCKVGKPTECSNVGAKKFYSYKSLDLQRLKEITQFYGSSTAAIWAPAAGALSAGMKVALMTVSGGMMSGYGELLDGTGFETLLTAGINPVAQFREAWALNESRLSKDQVLKNQFKGLMALEKVLGKIDARAASRRVAQDQSERSIVKDVPVKVTPTKQRGSTTSKQ